MPRGMVLGLVQRYDFTGPDISANNIINASYVMPETSKHPAVLFDHVDKGRVGRQDRQRLLRLQRTRSRRGLQKRDKLLFQVLKAVGPLIDETI